MNAVVKRVVPIALVIAFCAPVGACSSSSAGDITCSKFAELDSDDRMSVIYDMLDEHDRAKLDPGNLAGISSAIISYCGVGASKHPNEPINNAVDWEWDTW